MEPTGPAWLPVAVFFTACGPPRSAPRSGCSGRPRPNSPPTRRNVKPPTVTPDLGGLARTLPGVAEVGGPVLIAGMGRPARFGSRAAFKSYTGLAPRASETGNTDRKGQPMSKAGSSLLRTTLIRAADNARKQDPQLARIYHTQMVERGAEHLNALCVVAGALAERAWAVMNRQMPYVICDIDGAPVTPEQANGSSRSTSRSPTRSAADAAAAARHPAGNRLSNPPAAVGEGPSASRTRRHDTFTRTPERRRRHTRRPSPPTILRGSPPPGQPQGAGSGCAHPSGRPPACPIAPAPGPAEAPGQGRPQAVAQRCAAPLTREGPARTSAQPEPADTPLTTHIGNQITRHRPIPAFRLRGPGGGGGVGDQHVVMCKRRCRAFRGWPLPGRGSPRMSTPGPGAIAVPGRPVPAVRGWPLPLSIRTARLPAPWSSRRRGSKWGDCSQDQRARPAPNSRELCR